ncbi:MAG: class I SAM-dependent methyltransferase [Actinobacteria bacterium]|nr:class I SAM-dependent methyltransferase [Actinomycetota bacterium]
MSTDPTGPGGPDPSAADARGSAVAPEWETHAGWWQEFFTDGADPEYEEQILPLADVHLAGFRRVLDLGCGEGQLARRVAALGAEVIGVDGSWAQIRAARDRAGGPVYLRGAATALPVATGAVDAVMACLVLEHVDPFEPAIDEIVRVLAPGGRFVLFLNHPLLQAPGSGWIDDHILEEQYWRLGPYLPDDVSVEEVAPGVHLPFVHRPLSRYVNVLADRGLLVEHMDEPAPAPGFIARAPEYAHAAAIPRLLVLRTRTQV